MLEILIPTYNRASFLEKNLEIVSSQINAASVQDKVSIVISDNASCDETVTVIDRLKIQLFVDLIAYKQDKNIGLEANAVFLLRKATAPFVMYLGDDDYLPDGYIERVLQLIARDDELTCIIPGFSALYLDGSITPARNAKFKEKKFRAGNYAALKLAQYGHQLSGLVLKREGLVDAYCRDDSLRNLYPFIFFVAYNLLRGNGYYLPKYQVLVTQGNSKDWKYDDAGLVPDILRNFKILYPQKPLHRIIINFIFMSQQSWRLRIGKNPINAIKSLFFIVKSPSVDILTKVFLPLLYFGLYLPKLILYIPRKIYRAMKPSERSI